MTSPSDLDELASEVLDSYRRLGWRLATAESCTGGLVAAHLTEISGSSDVVERGFVVYSNEAKMDLLGVPAAMLEAHGAVSAETATAMAQGALAHSRAHVAVSVTGIAGPGGGSPGKPVGLVFFACAQRGAETHTERHIFGGERRDVRRASVRTALRLLRAASQARETVTV